MNRQLVCTALATLAATPMALAQSNNTIRSDKMTTGAPGNMNEVSPRNVVQKAAISNEFEMQSLQKMDKAS